MNRELDAPCRTAHEHALVSGLVADALGERALKVEPILGRGSVNRVFDVLTERARLIVRMNSAAYGVHSYEKERWAMGKARENGVPVPSVLAVRETESHVYMICTYVSGVSGVEYGGDTTRIWRQLGRYARIINTIESQGVGGLLADPRCGRFAHSWREWVAGEVRRLFMDDTFLHHGILSPQQVGQAKDALEGLFDWSFRPTLSHGNLSLENTIVNDCGAVTIIDWGNAVSHRSPHFDLAEVCAWNKDPSVAAAFSEGYGISRGEFSRMRADAEILQLWRILDCVRWNLKRSDVENGRKFVEYGIKKLKALLRA
jgi:aminoglycoside phosphotransferase (APT) family kinase protein